MIPHVFLATLCAGAIGLCTVTAKNDAKKEDQSRDERLLAQLLKLSKKMLDMQIIVREETKVLQKAIDDKKIRRTDKLAAAKLAAKQKRIIVEATKAIELLKGDQAVAFPEVF